MSQTKTRSKNALRASVSLALVAGLSTAGYGVAFAQSGADTEGRVSVTGSRLQRADLEGALPVTVIDRAQIQLSGEISVADLLRNTSFNSFGSFRPQSGSSATSFAGLALRGLGTGRTLILIDGRRAPVAPNVGSAQDLNSVPLAAVERIEILSDGASAIYGTDAIGGVVNIITRRDFNGVEATYGFSSPTRPGGDTEEGSLIFGASSDRARVLAGVGFNNRHIVWQRDRPWSAGGVSSFSNRFYTSDAGSALQHPTHGNANEPGCVDPGFTLTGTGTSRTCIYDFTFVAADDADVRNRSLFVRADFQINDVWSTYFNTSVGRVQAFGRYAPVPSSPWPGGGPLLPFGSPNHPATAPGSGGLNPLWADYQAPLNPVLCPTSGTYTHSTLGAQACTAGVDVLYYRYDPTGAAGLDPARGSPDLRQRVRFAALGPRDNNSDANAYDVQWGFNGRIAEVDLDVGVRQTESRFYGLGRNYVVAGLAQTAFEDGSYNIYDPTGNDPTVLAGMITTTARDSIFHQREAYAIANMDLFDMTGGMSAMAFGLEYREEVYADIYDTLSVAGQVVGSSGNSAAGGRDVTAAFFEVLLPATEDFEISLAGRYDRYSDFGSNFSPKIAMRWQPTDDITVRASWGQGFRAPTLDIVSQQPSFGAAGTTHIPSVVANGGVAGQTTQVTTYSIANPNMGPEDSTQWSLGVAWDATDWFNMSLDYYNIEITNRTAFIGVNTIAQCIRPGDWTAPTQQCPPGMSDWTTNAAIQLAGIPDPTLGIGIKYGGAGEILFAQTGYSNLGTIETDGFDFNGRFNFDLGDWGRLAHNLQIGYVRGYSTDGGPNAIDGRGAPKYRGSLQNRWSMGDFESVWNINYIHGQPGANVSSHTTHDLQLNYHASWNGRFTLGVRNLMNRDPALDPNDPGGRGYNFNLYDGYGRVPYFRYSQSF